MARDVAYGMRPDDYDRDVALTVTQFVLSPYVPASERDHFANYIMMFSHTMALGNIERGDILPIIFAFDEICMLLEIGLYEEARQIMGRELMKMQVSRSVEGFQTLFGQQGIQRTESIQRILGQRGRASTVGGRIARFFRGSAPASGQTYSSGRPMQYAEEE
jgi:hypothetical protein